MVTCKKYTGCSKRRFKEVTLTFKGNATSVIRSKTILLLVASLCNVVVKLQANARVFVTVTSSCRLVPATTNEKNPASCLYLKVSGSCCSVLCCQIYVFCRFSSNCRLLLNSFQEKYLIPDILKVGFHFVSAVLLVRYFRFLKFYPAIWILLLARIDCPGFESRQRHNIVYCSEYSYSGGGDHATFSSMDAGISAGSKVAGTWS